jgi:hypothetical protein
MGVRWMVLRQSIVQHTYIASDLGLLWAHASFDTYLLLARGYGIFAAMQVNFVVMVEYSLMILLFALVARLFCSITRDPIFSSTKVSHQFSLRNLLAVTTATSLVCAFCTLHRGLIFGQVARGPVTFFLIGISATGAAFSALGANRLAILGNLLPLPIIVVVIWSIFGMRSSWLFTVLILPIEICTAIPMLLLRFYGYRLHWRWSRKPPHPRPFSPGGTGGREIGLARDTICRP